MGDYDISNQKGNADITVRQASLDRANQLMTEAFAILDDCHHPAAARLDHVIVELGLRANGEGIPPSA